MKKENESFIKDLENFRKSLASRWQKAFSEVSTKWREFDAKSDKAKEEE